MIHPTAIVDPRAEIDASAVVGPYVRGYAPHPVWGRDYTSAYLETPR